MNQFYIFGILVCLLGYYNWLGAKVVPDYELMTSSRNQFDWLRIGLSISSAFLIIPAFLQAGGFGYKFGVWSMLVFVATYCLSFLIYSQLVRRFKEKYAQSVTLIDIAQSSVGTSAGNIYKIQSFLAPIYHIFVNLLGIKYVLKSWNFSPEASVVFTGIMCIGVIMYIWRGGLFTSIKTDGYQLILMVATLVIFGIYAFSHYNIANFVTNVNKPADSSLLLFPGMLFMFILTSGVLANQEILSRSLACKDIQSVKKTFWLASIITPCALLIVGLIGMFADPGLGNRDLAVSSLVSGSDLWIQLLFALFAISIATSNMDSAAVASALIISRNILKRDNIKTFQWALCLPITIAYLLSLFEIDLLLPLMVFSVYRTASMTLTACMAFGIYVKDRYYLLAFLLSLAVGGAFNYYSQINKLGPIWVVYGYLIIIGISAIPVLASQFIRGRTK